MYANCPKCGHAPLPANQASPAACPACGIILAKFAAMAAKAAVPIGQARAEAPTGGSLAGADRLPRGARAMQLPEEEEIDESTWLGYARSLVTHVPGEVSRLYWYARIATLAVLTLWTIWIFKTTDVTEGTFGGSNFLHGILLIFHEAGHVIFSLFGRFITILGGTLGQLLMPSIIAGVLLVQRRDPFGAALFAWLLGFSVIDMAIYMYDAFDPHLILLGGGTGQESDGHDWQNMFGDMGLIRRARGIGSFFGMLGRVMMLAALAWGGYLLWKQRARLSDSPMAEENP